MMSVSGTNSKYHALRTKGPLFAREVRMVSVLLPCWYYCHAVVHKTPCKKYGVIRARDFVMSLLGVRAVVSAAALEERQQKRAEQDGQNCLSS
jgi:hypothetical protein